MNVIYGIYLNLWLKHVVEYLNFFSKYPRYR